MLLRPSRIGPRVARPPWTPRRLSRPLPGAPVAAEWPNAFAGRRRGFAPSAADADRLGQLMHALNAEQRRVVQAPWNEPVLVVAGAGTGKTHTLILRLLHLIIEQRVDPYSVLVTTFSNKAAEELRERVARYSPHLANQICISTLHSLAYAIVRRHYPSAGYSKCPVVLSDRKEQLELWKRAFMESMDPQSSARLCMDHLLHHDGKWRADRAPLLVNMDTLLKTPNWLNVLEFARHSVKGGAKWKRAVNKAKFDCKGVFDHVHSDANISDMPPEFVKHLSFRIFMASVEAEFKYMDVMEKGKAQGRFPKPGDPNDAPWAKYQEYLTAMNMIDFGDMLALAVHLLEKDETIARLYRGRFQVALVDEFQDMNPVQMRMIVALRTRAITVVGDDDQAIYSFRGAVQAPFKYFRELMVSCGIISSTVDAILKNYILETNYRNTPQILFHANEIVQSIAQREYKLVRPTKLDGPRVVEVVRQHEASDAEQVVAQIEHLRDRENLPYSGVRILFRRFKRLWGSHTHKEIQRQLTLRGIPFEIVGGPSFLEAKAVKQVFGYLDLMLDPMNDKAFLRALSLPRRYGLGETSVTLKEIYRMQYDSRTLISLWKSAEMCLDRSAKMTRPKQELQKFLQELVDLHKFATTSSVSDLVNYVISIAREQPMIPDEDDDDEEAEAVEDAKLDRFTKDALQILASMAKQFDEAYLQDNSIKEGNGLIFLQEFVARSSLGENLSHTVKDKENQVCISTIHAAKGLESPCVFIMDADSKYLRKGELWSELEQVEAARVHHVGATRAMKYLYIYHKRIEVDELIRRHRAIPKPRHCVTDFSKIVT